MLARLPLELQLDILRLALPPLVSVSLRERAKACLAYALVHRSWTTAALKELHEHFSVTYGVGLPTSEAATTKLAAARAGGWAVKRLHVDMTGCIRSTANPNLLINEAMRGGTVEELWMWDYGNEGELPQLLPDTLRRLHLNLQLEYRSKEILSTPPAHLTYLEIIDATLDEFPSMPHLTTFLGYELWLDFPASRFFGAIPSLRNLALFLSRPSMATSIEFLPSTIRHIAYDADEQEHLPRPEGKRALVANLAKNLVSCTTFGSSSTRNKMNVMLEEECQKAGTRWTHVDYNYDSEWDSETWAWSVNAQ